MKWWQIRKRDADLERELRSDLELEEEEQRDNGKSPEEARYAAQRAFGNTTLIREQIHEAWGWAPLEQFWQDVRYGLSPTPSQSRIHDCRGHNFGTWSCAQHNDLQRRQRNSSEKAAGERSRHVMRNLFQKPDQRL